jgi:3-methylfumaryl-CoA hydratase
VHDYSATGEGVALHEEQRVVYRESTGDAPGERPGRPPHVRVGRLLVPGRAALTATLRADPVSLQRFSALTSNAHRIHYDHPYTTGVEGYPDLVVHGPLVLLALLELLRLDGSSERVREVDFTASAPVFCGDEVELVGTPDGDTVVLEAKLGGVVAMSASVGLTAT